MDRLVLSQHTRIDTFPIARGTRIVLKFAGVSACHMLGQILGGGERARTLGALITFAMNRGNVSVHFVLFGVSSLAVWTSEWAVIGVTATMVRL